MAKRFTDTDKWKKPFIKSLPAEYKLFWLFILDECDHSGLWHVEMDVAESRLGIKLSLDKARGFFNERIVELDSGTKWFIPDFIDFQYGRLSETNKAHKGVIEKIKKYQLSPLGSPLQGAKEKDKEKDMDKDKDKVFTTESLQEHFLDKQKFSIEHCLFLAMQDTRWVESNKTNQDELEAFNKHLERSGEYHKLPIDYKSHFSRWKPKQKFPVKPKTTYSDSSNQW